MRRVVKSKEDIFSIYKIILPKCKPKIGIFELNTR